MRTLIVTHFFPPETGAPQARLSSLAREWSARGDDVTVLTGFPNHPTGMIPPEYRGKRRMEEPMFGARVVRTWLYARPNERVLLRTLGHVSFMVSSVLLGTRVVGKQDVVVVSSPTFFSIFSAWLIARIKRARFVIELRDLWTTFAVELGMLRNPLLVKVLKRLELAAYRAADAVVVVSDGFRDAVVAEGVDAGKVHLVPNGVDLAPFANVVVDASIRERLGAGPSDVLAVYAGAHGTSYALGDVVEIADAMREEPVRFAFVGEGPAKAALQDRVTGLGLDSVVFVPSVPHEEFPALLAAADVCLVPDRALEFLRTVIRAKIFEYMAAGRPIVASAHGETADILREAGQVVVAPEDRAALEQALRDLVREPGLRARIGDAGRSYVATRYDRHVLAERYCCLLAAIVESSSR